MAKKKKPTQNIAIIGFADLKAMYDFVKEDHHKSFNKAKSMARDKLREIENELYERVYGYNPHVMNEATVEGAKPEDIDLSKFDAAAKVHVKHLQQLTNEVTQQNAEQVAEVLTKTSPIAED